MLGQALDAALGRPRAASPATAPRSCRWTRRARAARSTSPGGPSRCSRPTCPRGSTGGFEHELTEEFFRALANAAKLTLHLRVEAGSNAHHMIEAAFKAFARALRQAVAIDPTETGRAEHEGYADRMSAAARRSRVEIAVVDYGMGNRRSVEKALEHVGARATHQRRPRAPARRRRARACPGVGAFPRAMAQPARARPRRAAARARRRGHAGARHLPGHAARLRVLHRARRGARASGIVPGEVRALQPGGAEAARTSAGTRSRFAQPGSPLLDGPARALRLLPRALARARARRASGTCSGPPSTAAPFVTAVAARLLLRRAVPPREVLRRRPAPAGQLRAHLRRRAGARRPVRLYPAIDILGGSAVRLVQGRLRRQEGLRRGPAVGGARLGRRRARGACTSSTSTAPRPGEPVNLEHLRRIAAELGRAGAVRRRAALGRGGRATRSRRAPRA